MAGGFGIRVQGLDTAIQQMKGAGKKVTTEADGLFRSAANLFVRRAIQAAPADRGFLRTHISAEQLGTMKWAVVSSEDYSAYMEFGTGQYVQVPAGLESYASQFRGKGQSGGKVRELIYEWCRRKGIDKGAWWFIYVSIMTKGVRPHPFFFIQGPVVGEVLIKDLRKLKIA
jgi:hypothetical protein